MRVVTRQSSVPRGPQALAPNESNGQIVSHSRRSRTCGQLPAADAAQKITRKPRGAGRTLSRSTSARCFHRMPLTSRPRFGVSVGTAGSRSSRECTGGVTREGRNCRSQAVCAIGSILSRISCGRAICNLENAEFPTILHALRIRSSTG